MLFRTHLGHGTRDLWCVVNVKWLVATLMGGSMHRCNNYYGLVRHRKMLIVIHNVRFGLVVWLF